MGTMMPCMHLVMELCEGGELFNKIVTLAAPNHSAFRRH